MLEHHEPEASATQEVTGALDDFLRTFEAYKQTNDDRLQDLEKRSTADVLTTSNSQCDCFGGSIGGKCV